MAEPMALKVGKFVAKKPALRSTIVDSLGSSSAPTDCRSSADTNCFQSDIGRIHRASKLPSPPRRGSNWKEMAMEQYSTMGVPRPAAHAGYAVLEALAMAATAAAKGIWRWIQQASRASRLRITAA